MKTASCKAKGRRLQDNIVRWLKDLNEKYSLGLESGDIKAAIMGSSGVDVVLSPHGQKIFDVKIECKNQERLNVTDTFVEHFSKYHYKKNADGEYTKFHNGDTSLKLLIHNRNYLREGPLVTMRFDDFLTLVEKAYPANALAQPFLVPKEKDEETA